MSKNPLEVNVKNDKIYFDHVMQARDLSFTNAALSAKTKILMAMALDPSIPMPIILIYPFYLFQKQSLP